MRISFAVATTAVLALCSACAGGTLYSRFAGPAASPADAVYACVQSKTKELGYVRVQYNDRTRWYMAQKAEQSQVSSGLYRKTVHILDTTVKDSESGAVLDITAHTYDEYSNARGVERDERKASDRVQADARTLGQACTQ